MQKVTIDTIQNAFKSKQESIDTAILKWYTLIEELFVDSSGFGSPSEPAYTQSQFIETLTKILADYPTVYTCITSAGQFQVYIWVFHKSWVTTKRTKKLRWVATYRVEYDDGHAIRYHDTDVIRFSNWGIVDAGASRCDSNTRITLDNGGWFSKTTKERINEYLPSNYYISQSKWLWYIVKRELWGYKDIEKIEWKRWAKLDNITIK